MLIFAMVLFVIAAIFGGVVLVAVLEERTTPKPAVFTHGILALTAIIVLSIYVFVMDKSPLLITSLALFIMAAMGGLTMFTIDLKKKPIPKVIAMVHPLVAIAGLIMLIIHLLSVHSN